MGGVRQAGGEQAFEPETVTAMADALYEVCIALNISEERAYDRDIIAERIIDLARDGIVDAKVLRDRILAEAQISS